MLQQATLEWLLLPAVEPVPPAAPKLAPEKSGGGLQLVGPLDDGVTGEGVLDERWGLPGLAPAPSGIQHDLGWQLVHGRQGPVKRCGLVEVGAGIDPIPLQGHVVGPEVTELKHPGLDAKSLGLLDRNSVGNDEVPVHENVADAAFLQQLPQERPPGLHRFTEGNAELLREAEFVQREQHLRHRDSAALQVAAETSKKQADRPHQQQDRSLDAHLHQCRRPPLSQIAVQHWKDPGTPQRRRSRPQWRNRACTRLRRAGGAARQATSSSIACSGVMNQPLWRLT